LFLDLTQRILRFETGRSPRCARDDEQTTQKPHPSLLTCVQKVNGAKIRRVKRREGA